MVVLLVAVKDLARVVADRKALLVNILLPLLLTFIMGLSFGGGLFGETQISAIPLDLVGEDVPEPLRDRIAAGLEETEFFSVSWVDSAAARRRVTAGEVRAALVLPTDLLDRFFTGDTLSFVLWKDPGSAIKAGIVEQILRRALAPLQAGEAAYRSLWPDADLAEAPGPGGMTWEEFLSGDVADVWMRWRELGADPSLAAAADRLLAGVDRQVALSEAMREPTVALEVHGKADGPADAEGGQVNLFNYFLPSFSVFFLMFGIAAGARDLHRERASGTLQRQLLAPVSPLQLLAGKWVAAAVQGALQLMVLFVAGSLLFDVNLGPDPFSLLAVVTGAAAAATSLFMFLAVVTRDEKLMDNLTTTVILISALVGGNMIPLEAMPEWAHLVGRWVFNYWANRGFAAVMSDDRSIVAEPLPVYVLTGIAACFVLATLAAYGLRRRKGGLA